MGPVFDQYENNVRHLQQILYQEIYTIRDQGKIKDLTIITSIPVQINSCTENAIEDATKEKNLNLQ